MGGLGVGGLGVGGTGVGGAGGLEGPDTALAIASVIPAKAPVIAAILELPFGRRRFMSSSFVLSFCSALLRSSLP